MVQRDQDVVSDRRVRPNLIGVSTPTLLLFAGIRKGEEPMGVQAFRPKLTVEGFDDVIARWSARP